MLTTNQHFPFLFAFKILMDNSDYHSFRDKASKVLKNKVRFAPIEERKDTGELSCEALCSISHGKN